MKLEEISLKVISYCSIPQDITDGHWLSDHQPDAYVKYQITSKEEQEKFDDDFAIDNWILEKYPELEGAEILIHVDY